MGSDSVAAQGEAEPSKYREGPTAKEGIASGRVSEMVPLAMRHPVTTSGTWSIERGERERVEPGEITKSPRERIKR